MKQCEIQKNELQKDCQFLNFDDVCTRYKIKPSKLRSMIFKNEIPVLRIGRLLRFKQEELKKWENQK